MLIVAEISANHHGSLVWAKRIITAAAEAGADAVKLQTFTPEQMVGNTDYIVESGPWMGWKLLDVYRKAYTPREWHKELFDHAKTCGVECFSTPFHPDDVAFLETLGCPRYKIASFELLDLDLIEAASKTGKPIILSTGMATGQEIATAIRAAMLHGCTDLTVLKCTSAYPADPSEANLATMTDMRERFGLKVGLSDHTPGIGVACAAAALGADMIEKHLKLTIDEEGLDAAFSITPEQFKSLAREARAAHKAIGKAKYGPTTAEADSVPLRRSLWVSRDIKAGEEVDIDAIKVARPALGAKPSDLHAIAGARAKTDIKAGTPLTWDLVS